MTTPCPTTIGRTIPTMMRRVSQLAGWASLAAALLLGTPVSASPIRIFAAGSLTATMKALIEASGLPAGAFAPPVFGPAGLLGERLAKGEPADLFASADMAQPGRLAAGHPAVLVVPFARNRMCVASMPSAGLDSGNLIDRLLDPGLRLATSTPGADPGGDYAMAVFDRAEQVHSGAGAVLRAKALHLLGGPTTMVPSGGHSPAGSIFLDHKADALIYYCSSAGMLAKEVDGLVNLPLPEALEVHPTYGLAVLSDDPPAARFALFILSRKGQEILSGFGFLPIGPDR